MNWRAQSILMLAVLLVLAGCQEGGEDRAQGPEFSEAKRLLAEVQAVAVDPDYEDQRFDAVIEAFRRVPADSPDRPLADYWIERIRAARAEARTRRARVRAEVRDLGALDARTPSAMVPSHARPKARLPAIPRSAARADPVPAGDETAEARRAAERLADSRKRRTREYWQARHKGLKGYVRDLEKLVKVEQRRVTIYCRGLAWAPIAAGREPAAQVRHEPLSEVSHAPEEIKREDPTMVACEEHKKSLARAEERLEAASRELAGLAEEARRADVPPGWLRLQDEPPEEEPEEPRLPDPPPAQKP